MRARQLQQLGTGKWEGREAARLVQGFLPDAQHEALGVSDATGDGRDHLAHHGARLRVQAHHRAEIQPLRRRVPPDEEHLQNL